eukprot:m.260306 g.260306  ORF g.260306 m.260306 type:complete len:98 (+) comp15557_c0_seq3:390-683(+)
MTNAFVLAGCCVPLGDTMWMNFGTMFAKVPTATAVELISQDQADLETAAEEVRVHLKETTRQLQKQRGETLHPGFDLVGTSDKERAQFVASGSTKSS